MKFPTIVLAVLLISGARAALINRTLSSLRANMENALAGYQKAVSTLVDEAQEIVLGLEEDSVEMFQMVSLSVSAKKKKIDQKLSNIINAAGDMNVKECIDISERLKSVERNAISSMKSCVDSQTGKGNETAEGIINQLNRIVGSLDSSRKDALKKCAINVDGIRDVAEAVVCINEIASKVTSQTVHGIANISNPVSELEELPLAFFEPALKCIGKEGYKSFKKESLKIIDDVENCVNSKISESKASPPLNRKQPVVSSRSNAVEEPKFLSAPNPQPELSLAPNPQKIESPTSNQEQSKRSPLLNPQQPPPSGAEQSEKSSPLFPSLPFLSPSELDPPSDPHQNLDSIPNPELLSPSLASDSNGPEKFSFLIPAPADSDLALEP